MSGHSKWKQIKYKKGAADAARGKVFTKLANAITVAAKGGGGDAGMNFKLRLAIDAAKAQNMPKENIDRAIKRGTGALGGTLPEEVVYEGYGPAGVAIMVKALSDNRNRTVSDVRNVFTKNGGNLGDSGAVSYLFDQKGHVQMQVSGDIDDLMMKIIELGAEDIEVDADTLDVYTKPADLERIKKEIENLGQKIEAAEILMESKTTIKISDEATATKLLKLMDQLEELEDVEQAYANFDIPEDIINKIS